MTETLIIVAYAQLPALGHFIGSLLAEMTRPRRWVVGASLHGAAGIAIALIALELTPRILDGLPGWAIVVGFLVGAGASFALVRVAAALRGGLGAAFRAWMVYVAVGVDLATDGLTTGVSGAVALNLGVFVAAAQLFANVPGGFAACATLREHGVPVHRRFIAAAGMVVVVSTGAFLGRFALHAAPDMAKNAALAVIVGLLLLATIEDVVPEGDAPRPPRWSSTLAFACGFAGLALATFYLG